MLCYCVTISMNEVFTGGSVTALQPTWEEVLLLSQCYERKQAARKILEFRVWAQPWCRHPLPTPTHYTLSSFTTLLSGSTFNTTF